MKGSDIILGLLMNQARTGYEINEILKSVFSHFYKTSYGMIYPTLKKLQKEGFVEKSVVIQEGKPNKNIFSITDSGKSEFTKYLESSLSPEVRESDFLVRMYLGEHVSEETLLYWIKAEIQEKKNLISELEEKYTSWVDDMTFSQKISYEIGIKQYTAEIEILNEKVALLES